MVAVGSFSLLLISHTKNLLITMITLSAKGGYLIVSSLELFGRCSMNIRVWVGYVQLLLHTDGGADARA